MKTSMNLRRLLLAAVLVLSLLAVTGCWNRRELNELTIVFALGIDKAEDGYLVSVQLVNAQEIASKGGSGYATPITVYSSKGATVFEALRRMSTKLNRRMYLSHIRAVVIGEEVARQGVGDALDFLSRDHELRTDFFVLIARESRAEQILGALTPLEKIPANKMYSALQVMKENWAGETEITLDDLLSDMLSKGTNPVVTGIQLTGSTQRAMNKSNVGKTVTDTVLRYHGMAAFRDDRLAGWLTEEEAIGFNYVLRNLKSSIVNLRCPGGGGKVAMELTRIQSKIRASAQDGAPEITIRLETEANIGDVECPLKVMDIQTVPEIEQRLEEAIRGSIRAGVQASQKRLKTDIFGFGNAVHRDQPKIWKQVQTRWESVMPGVPVEVEVDAKLRRVGTVKEPVNHKKEAEE
ncbi:Ger(x)C family spore germination protein [Paenibacillus sp. KR2-11]|uniref:Ger(x)C family spore germination protein n=1 Tax=Paenibacillus sp. KR2-11 TaxID=3385500 RepID=UPI0038FCDA56